MRTALSLLIVTNALAGTVTRTFSFRADALVVTAGDGGARVVLPDAELTDIPGAPALPCVAVNVELPRDSRATGIRIIDVQFEDLAGEFVPAPARPPVILSLPANTRAAPPDPTVYASDSPWPDAACRLTGQGLRRGVPVVSLAVFPVRFLPVQHRLQVLRRLEVAVDYEPALLDEPVRDSGPLEYLVVTGPALDTVFAGLADWKRARGLRSAVRRIDAITASHAGRDDAEKLRNYLKACRADSGLKWVLLGGDVDVIPCRKAFAMACSAGIHPREDSLPCDLYYSDLDDDWDRNGNSLFGEVADSVDLYPDVFVGRAPVSTPAQARAFVAKVMRYENSWYNDYQRRAVFTAFVLWENPFTDEAIAKDRIDERHVPPRFDPIRKLYHTRGAVNRDTVVAELNRGCGLFNHCGHGWIDVMGLSGFEKLRNGDMAALTNDGRFGVGFSIGCWTTAFDFDAIAEQFVRNPQGGGVAFVGNSSYGWGSPGNPGFGYSDRFDARFFAELFSSAEPRAGELLARTKEHFIPHSHEANVYRWHQYCLNLIGDPEMPVHADTLAPILAQLPSRLPVGSGPARVIVQDRRGPLAGATVVIRKADETWARARTGADGTALLEPRCLTAGRAEVIVSAAGHKPLIESLPVWSGACISLAELTLDDSTGNRDGRLNPGESAVLLTLLRNSGAARSGPLRCQLTTSSDFVSVPAAAVLVPALDTGATVLVAFPVGAGATARNGQTAVCTLTVRDSVGAWWHNPFALQIAQPALEVIGAFVRDPSLARAGEPVEVSVRVRNTGLAPAREVSGNVFQNDPWLSPLVPGLLFPDLAPGETAWSLTSARATVSPAATLPAVLRLGVNLAAPGMVVGDTLRLLLGAAGLDTNAVGFTHGGTPDLWHRLNDSSAVWHAGVDTGPYPPHCNSWLLSPLFVMPEQAELKFRRRFDVPIYGADGCYVIVQTANRAETLDFIGSGGALRPSVASGRDGIFSDWFEETCDLSAFPAGTEAGVRFSFISDGDNAAGRGFYLTAVSVQSAAAAPSRLVPDTARMLAAFPTPFRTGTTVVFGMAAARPASVRVFDRSGRLVRVLHSGMTSAGHHAVRWDGTDGSGRRAASGVYFVRLQTAMPGYPPPAHQVTRRIVLMN